MKKIVMVAIAACIIGCGNEAEAKTTSLTTDEIANVIVVPNTSNINYSLYRQEWRKANNKPAPVWAPDYAGTMKTHKDPEDTHEIVEI